MRIFILKRGIYFVICDLEYSPQYTFYTINKDDANKKSRNCNTNNCLRIFNDIYPRRRDRTRKRTHKHRSANTKLSHTPIRRLSDCDRPYYKKNKHYLRYRGFIDRNTINGQPKSHNRGQPKQLNLDRDRIPKSVTMDVHKRTYKIQQ